MTPQHDITWAASWITAAHADAALPLFRKVFHVDDRISRAAIAICGLGHFELRMNGEKVGDDVLEPGWTNYAKSCLYVIHDVSDYVRAGENVVAVLLGNGMYNVTGGRYRKFKGSFGPPKLIAQVEIELPDGSSTRVVSDATWRTSPGPITFSCIYGGEDFDAQREQAGWDAPDFDDASWPAAQETEGPGGTLTRQDSPPIRVMRTFEPIKVEEPQPRVRVYDRGQNFSGWPMVAVRGEAGATVNLVTGELLDEHGHVTQKHTGSPVSFSYTARGAGAPESWRPRFSYTGFRYVQAEGDVSALLRLQGQFIHAAAPVAGHFACSNELFNRIHELILAAIRSNMQSVLTDCPHREKLGWLEQAHLMAPSIMANFDVARWYAKICRDMRDAQRDDGCVPTIAPQYTTFKPPWDIFNDSPEWVSAMVLVPWLVYQRYGDKRILWDNYAAMRRYVEYLRGREQNGLLDYGLGDWYDIGDGEPGFSKLTSTALTATAIYYRVAEVMARVARLLRQADDAERFGALARRVKQNFNARLFDPETHRYDRGSQTACAMPLALDLVDPLHRDAVLEQLIGDIRRRNNHVTAGDIGFHFVLTAVAQAGRSDVIYDLLSRTDPPSYGAQLVRGATTLTEAWDANPKNSQNHLMLGHAEAWFYEWLAGIQLDLSCLPGAQLKIRPTPVGDVTWVKSDHQSALGPITVAWRRSGKDFELDVEVPVAASVHLPDASVHQVVSGLHKLHCRISTGVEHEFEQA